MRSLLLATLVLACLANPGKAATPVSDQDGAAIRSVIANQVDAFRHDDAAAAFGYAAPSTQGVFGTADSFLEMVRRGYPPVYRPQSFEFGKLTQDDDGIVQMVEVVGPDGLSYTARYTVEHEADGSWRIIACELLQSRRLNV